MVCKYCGAEIKEGMDYCMNCGELTEEKEVVKTVKVMPVEAQPFFDFSGYVKSMQTKRFTVLSLLGALCLYISPFMKWMEKTVYGEGKVSGSLFDIGSKNSVLSIREGKMIFFAVCTLIVALYMMVMSAKKYIRPLRLCNNFIIRLLPAVMAIVIFVLIYMNKTYSKYCDFNNISLFGCSGHILFILGILLYGISLCIENKEK